MAEALREGRKRRVARSDINARFNGWARRNPYVFFVFHSFPHIVA
jgi:hypothetical protein